MKDRREGASLDFGVIVELLIRFSLRISSMNADLPASDSGRNRAPTDTMRLSPETRKASIADGTNGSPGAKITRLFVKPIS